MNIKLLSSKIFEFFNLPQRSLGHFTNEKETAHAYDKEIKKTPRPIRRSEFPRLG